MPSPFPGMDPYIEGSWWESFHALFSPQIVAQLQPKLRPKYWISIHHRVYEELDESPDLVGLPDNLVVRERATIEYSSKPVSTTPRSYKVDIPISVEIREQFLEIRTLPGEEVVTVIELLSLSNKRPGPGRKKYIEKRSQILGSITNLVEIDLHRTGGRLPMEGAPASYDYGFLVRWGATDRVNLFECSVREQLPVIPIPLAEPDPDVDLDLQSAFAAAYDMGDMGYPLKYAQPPEIPLRPEDAEWADSLLREKGLR